MSAGEDTLAFQMRAVGLPDGIREYAFAAADGRRWRFDFAWPLAGVALEVEGGTFAAGRHSRGTGFAQDCVKYSEAAIRGWRVLRVTTDMVDDGTALRLLERALAGTAAVPAAAGPSVRPARELVTR